MRNLGLVYSIVESERKDYLIDHSASIVLINPAGKLVALFRPKVAPGKCPALTCRPWSPTSHA